MDAIIFQDEVLKIERLLYHVAYTALGNRQECADAVQEALLRAWKKRNTLRSQEHFKAWMVRILLNTIADGKRRGKPVTTELSDILPAEEKPDNLPSMRHFVRCRKACAMRWSLFTWTAAPCASALKCCMCPRKR